MHILAPGTENRPTAQLMQLDPPENAWKVPAAQFVQPLEPTTDTIPAEQSVHLESPPPAAYFPAGHAMHLAAAAEPENWPIKQSEQLVLDEAPEADK